VEKAFIDQDLPGGRDAWGLGSGAGQSMPVSGVDAISSLGVLYRHLISYMSKGRWL
jgi:hypothetical protein